MSRIQYQSLLVRHLGQILHGQTVLGPVLESRAVTAIHDELVGMLGDGHIQIVGYHEHDGRCLTALMWKVIYAAGIDLIIGTQAVHVDPSVCLQLFLELRNQCCMMFRREIAQSVAQCQLLLIRCQYLLPVGSMVDRGVKRFGCRKFVRNTLNDCFLKISHIVNIFVCVACFGQNSHKSNKNYYNFFLFS